MAAPIPATPEGVLDFWFGKVENTVKYFESNWPKWFGGRDVIFDVAQRTSASLIHQLAALDNTKSPRDAAWDSARGKLARIIALDQFSRCAFRGTAEAFAFDQTACRLGRGLAESGAFDELQPIERFFVCVALSHAEDAADNQLHVQLASRIADGAPADVAAYFASLNGFPHEHADCIARFGRFPHRNALLGRESRPEEAAWLQAADCPGWARSQRPATLTYWRGRGLGDPVPLPARPSSCGARLLILGGRRPRRCASCSSSRWSPSTRCTWTAPRLSPLSRRRASSPSGRRSAPQQSVALRPFGLPLTRVLLARAAGASARD